VALCWGGLLILAGCSRVKVVPVEGRLTLTDGEPSPSGHVVFVPIEKNPNIPRSVLPPEGIIKKKDGSYTLFWNGQSGAPVGKYRVVFRSSMDRRWSVVPAEYFDPEKSPLEVEIAENKPEGGYDLQVQARSGQARSGQRDPSRLLLLKEKRLKEEQTKDKQTKSDP
jgi:hypothetical protein